MHDVVAKFSTLVHSLRSSTCIAVQSFKGTYFVRGSTSETSLHTGCVPSGIASAAEVNASNIKVYNFRSFTTDTSKVTVQV
jgi:hypothetical protein